MIERKKGLPINEELLKRIREADEDGFFGDPNTMARKKLKRKVLLYDIKEKTTYGQTLKFEDLKVGDIFCLYEPNGAIVLCNNKYEVMIVREIKVKRTDRSELVFDVDPYIIK